MSRPFFWRFEALILFAGLLLAALWIAIVLLAPDQLAAALSAVSPVSNTSLAMPNHPDSLVAQTPSSGPAGLPATAPSRPPTSNLISSPSPSPSPSPTATPTPLGLRVPTRLMIPEIGLDAPIVPVSWKLVRHEGRLVPMWEVPDDAVGWHSDSAMWGQVGNVVLSGHHNIGTMVFRDVHRLKLGDFVTLIAGDAARTYRVRETLVVQETGAPPHQREKNAQWIGPFPDERLTLVTCWPANNNTHRVIVVAVPVDILATLGN